MYVIERKGPNIEIYRRDVGTLWTCQCDTQGMASLIYFLYQLNCSRAVRDVLSP